MEELKRLAVVAVVLLLIGPAIILTILLAGAVFSGSHYQELTTELFTLLKIGLAVLFIGGMLYLGIILWHRWVKTKFVHDEGQKQVRVIRGRKGETNVLPYPLFPNLTSYRHEYRTNQEQQLLPGEVEAGLEEGLPDADPFSRMERAIDGYNHLVFGYKNKNDPVTGSFEELRSAIGIIGKPGQGKSSTARYWIAMAIKARIAVMLIDPHGSIVGKLGAGNIYYAEDESGFRALASYVHRILDERKKKGAVSSFVPILLFVDEWIYVSRYCPEVVEAIGRVILEGRKYAMCAVILGHGLPANSIGSTTIRDAVSTLYILYSSALQARLAGLETTAENAGQLELLRKAPPGTAIFSILGRNPTLLRIPKTTVEDIKRLLAAYGGVDIPEIEGSLDAIFSPEEDYLSSLSQDARPEHIAPLSFLRRGGERGQAAREVFSKEEKDRILGYARQNVAPSAIPGLLGRSNNLTAAVKAIIEEAQGPERGANDDC